MKKKKKKEDSRELTSHSDTVEQAADCGEFA